MGIELLQRMIEFYSPSGQEAPLADFLKHEMTHRGFVAKLDAAGNVVGQIGTGKTQVYLVGHIDTVLGEIPIRHEAGRLYGRGAVDAKGCMAAFIEAATLFKDSDQLVVTVIGCVGEEADSQGAKHLIASGEHAPNVVVIGEPSGWDAVTLGYKGSVNLSCRVVQERHHGGHADPTAAERALGFYMELRAEYGSDVPTFDSTHMKLYRFSTTSDGLQEGAEFTVNLRTPVGFNFSALLAHLDSLSSGIEIEIGEITPAFRADKQNPLVRGFLRAIRTIGGRPAFKVKTGTSDMNLLGPAWGVPILAYGPGDSSLDHTPHEHIEIADYERAVAVLEHALAALAA